MCNVLPKRAKSCPAKYGLCILECGLVKGGAGQRAGIRHQHARHLLGLAPAHLYPLMPRYESGLSCRKDPRMCYPRCHGARPGRTAVPRRLPHSRSVTTHFIASPTVFNTFADTSSKGGGLCGKRGRRSRSQNSPFSHTPPSNLSISNPSP